MAKSYLTRISHVGFYRDGDELVIESERDEDFEQRHDWPDDLSASDEDLFGELYERYYVEVREQFE